MYTKRSTDGYLLIAAFIRNDRLVTKDGDYFYRTREQEFIGPYPTESIAEFELNIFLHIKTIEQELLGQYSKKAA